jgi:hypothetical protein
MHFLLLSSGTMLDEANLVWEHDKKKHLGTFEVWDMPNTLQKSLLVKASSGSWPSRKS